jgi:hypothetical protein
VHFVGFDPAGEVNLYTDDIPVGCTSWINENDGSGWVDLVNGPPGFPGELLIFGNVNCCEEPVATEDRTWGDVKSLFR